MADRKFVLIRVARGDYIVPSNDGLTLYRIARYDDPEAEVGPKYGWGVHTCSRHSFDSATFALDWECWTYHEAGFKTRAEAIKAIAF